MNKLVVAFATFIMPFGLCGGSKTGLVTKGAENES